MTKITNEEMSSAINALAEENRALKAQVNAMKGCHNCKHVNYDTSGDLDAPCNRWIFYKDNKEWKFNDALLGR